MTRTLDSFNTEWYELQAKGRLGEEYTTKVPDIYLRNEELDEQVNIKGPPLRLMISTRERYLVTAAYIPTKCITKHKR